jgi:hypothetical protein
MRTLTVVNLIPSLLVTLLALACESPPDPVAANRPSFAAQDPKVDRITGGGKLGDGRDFATFGFNARDGQGQFQWVQHCLDGATSSPNCLLGGFTFHGSTVTTYGFTPGELDHCRAWSGEGEAKFKDQGTASPGSFSVKACDFQEPGRGHDTICFTFTTFTSPVVTYIRGNTVASGTLSAGNIQLHEGAPDPATATCLAPEV